MIDIPDFAYYFIGSYWLTGKKITPIYMALLNDIHLPVNIEEKLKAIKIKPNRCYQNAYQIANLTTDAFPIHYVEGEAILSIDKQVIFHAFNYLPTLNVYFDLTWENLRPDLYCQATYYPIFNDLLGKLIEEQKTAPPFWYKWREQALKNLDASCPLWWLLLEKELNKISEI